jgi:hypothetical protein
MKSKRNVVTEASDKESKIMILDNQEIYKHLKQLKQGTNMRQHNKIATLGKIRVNCSEHNCSFTGFLSGAVNNSVLSPLVNEKSYRVRVGKKAQGCTNLTVSSHIKHRI